MPVEPDPAVSGEFLGGRLKVSHRSVKMLAERGVIERVGPNRYPLWASIGAAFTHLRKQAAGRAASGDDDGPPDLARERALLARAQREAQDMKNDILRGGLLPVDDVEAVVGAVLDATRAKMLAIPTKLASRCVGLAGMAEARDVLTTAIHEALEELSSTEVVVVASVDRARQSTGGRAADDAFDEAAEASAEVDGQPMGRRVPPTQ